MNNKTKMWQALEEFRKNSTEQDSTVKQILSNAAVFIKSAIPQESFHIRMINPDTSNLDLKKGEGIYFRHAPQTRKLEQIGDGSAYAASTREIIRRSNVSFKTIEGTIVDELSEEQQKWLKQVTGYVVLPLIFRRRVIGTLSVHFSDENIVSDPTNNPVQDVLQSFANALSNALWLVISAQEGKEMAKSLRKFDSIVAENISPEDRRIAILRECTKSMCKLTSATFVFYYEYDGAAEILTTRSSFYYGYKAPNLAPPQNLPSNVGIAGIAVINKQSQCVLNFQGSEWNNKRKSVLDTLQHEHEKAFVNWIPDMKVIPVVVNNEVDGVFVAITPLANWFSTDDQNTLEFLADKIGACLKAIQVDSRLALQSSTLKNISLISYTMGKAPDKDVLHRLFLLAVSSGHCLRFSQAVIFLNNEDDSDIFNAIQATGFGSREEAVPSFQRGALDTLDEQIEVCKKNKIIHSEGALELHIKDFSLNLKQEDKISKYLNENRAIIKHLGESHLI